jgi:Tol biopolymer transport system component
MRSLVGIVTVVAGCGRIDFDSRIVADGAVDGSIDAAIDAALGPFGPPSIIPELSDPSDDDDVTLTADGLEIYWASDRGSPGDDDIWFATRADPAGPFGAPQMSVELSTVDGDQNPGLAPDGLTIWYATSPGASIDLFVSTRPDRGSPWSAPVPVTELNTGNDDQGPEPYSMTRMVFYATVPGMDRELFETTRSTEQTAWNPPVAIAELNTPYQDLSPFLAGELELYFTSDRPGGNGQRGIYRANRPDVGSPFATPTLVDELDSADNDDDVWLSPDGRRIVFSSDRSGNVEIYQASR